MMRLGPTKAVLSISSGGKGRVPGYDGSSDHGCGKKKGLPRTRRAEEGVARRSPRMAERARAECSKRVPLRRPCERAAKKHRREALGLVLGLGPGPRFEPGSGGKARSRQKP